MNKEEVKLIVEKYVAGVRNIVSDINVAESASDISFSFKMTGKKVSLSCNFIICVSHVDNIIKGIIFVRQVPNNNLYEVDKLVVKINNLGGICGFKTGLLENGNGYLFVLLKEKVNQEESNLLGNIASICDEMMNVIDMFPENEIILSILKLL